MKKILAIDDNEINLELLYQVVKLHYPDFEFLRASNGEEGIDLARETKPELILLDILMPGLNGYEVCKILKSEDLLKDIPILMISALGQDSIQRTKGLNAGADAFISKPFSQSELRASINVALRIKGVEDLLRKRNKNLEEQIKSQTNKYLQSEERFLQISEHAMEFYWEVDSEGVFTYVSPVVEKTLQISHLDIVGKKKYQDIFQFSENQNVAFEGDSSFNDFEVELRIVGVNIWLSISGFSIFNKKGNCAGKRGVCYTITKRKQAELALKENLQKIEDYQKRLKNLNIEITLVEEKERRRIAENLHDSLGQTLSLAFLKLSSIIAEDCSPKVKTVITETSDLLDSAISESRSLTYDLSPPILYELGLIPAFKWKLEQIEEKHGFNTVLIGENIQIKIQKEFNIFLYRIVSELLTNIIKHAKAKRIELEISIEKETYCIFVRDNGIGFVNRTNKKASLGGFGLMSIKERMEIVKGHFEIESKEGKGTKAKIVIPFGKD